MTKSMMPYYLSRIFLSVGFGGLLYVTGTTLLEAMLFGGLILVFFLLAPISGRYAVHPEFGITALRRDERTQGINEKAACNAFIACALTICGISVYASYAGIIAISIRLLYVVLLAGAFTYYASDFWLRVSQR